MVLTKLDHHHWMFFGGSNHWNQWFFDGFQNFEGNGQQWFLLNFGIDLSCQLHFWHQFQSVSPMHPVHHLPKEMILNCAKRFTSCNKVVNNSFIDFIPFRFRIAWGLKKLVITFDSFLLCFSHLWSLWRDHCKFSMVFEETITIECFLGGLTIAINGFTMVFWCCYHRFQWFSMVPDHWSNDAMVSMDRCGLLPVLDPPLPRSLPALGLAWILGPGPDWPEMET